MPLISKWLHIHIKNGGIEHFGVVVDADLDPRTIRSTRPFLDQIRMLGIRRRASVIKPEIIETRGRNHAVDGHHKIRRAIDSGEASIHCRVLKTSDGRVAARLDRMDHGPIGDLPIR